MWEDAGHHRHPSYIIETSENQPSIYDPSSVDYLDLQSLSLNYPPIKPERREDIHIDHYSDPSSHTSSTQDPPSPSTDSDSDKKPNMHPAWFVGSTRRDRSSETQVPYDLSPNDSLPSYNDLYEHGTGLPSAGMHNWTGDPANDLPIEGALDFSLWERDDPEGEACLAAVSSASRGSDEVREVYENSQEHMVGVENHSGRTSRLVDFDADDGNTSYAASRFPTDNAQYTNQQRSLSSFPALTPSRPSGSYNPHHEYQVGNQQDYHHDHPATQYDSNLVPGEDMSSYPSVSDNSKRKYDDDDYASYDSNEINIGMSTQVASKRPRTQYFASQEEEEMISNNTAPLLLGDEWQSEESDDPSSEDQLESEERHQNDGSDISQFQNNHVNHDLGRGDQEWPSDDLTIVNDPNVEWEEHEMNDPPLDTSQQQPSEYMVDSSSADWQEQEMVNRDATRYSNSSDDHLPIDSNVVWEKHRHFNDHTQDSQRLQSQAMINDSDAESQRQADDNLTQVPQYSQDNAMDVLHTSNARVTPIPIDSLETISDAQEEVEMVTLSHPLGSINSLPTPSQSVPSGSRKRPADETPGPAQSPIHKRSRRPPAPKIVLAKALPKPPPIQHPNPSTTDTPQSSPVRHKNTTLGMKPRKPWNSSPNRPSSTPVKKELVLDQGPSGSFASHKASQKTGNSKIKQKAFKSPLAGGTGNLFKPKDSTTTQSSRTDINYGHAQSSIPTSAMPITAQIAALEKEARTLRQAVKYQTEQEEDERLRDLIIQWRTAGRDVVEQIFDRIPEPIEGEETRSSNRNPWMQGSGGDGMELTADQERWLKDCRKNEDGEPVDDEGNTLLIKPNEMDLTKLIAEESKGRRGEKEGYYPRYEHDGSGKSKQVAVEAREWNMGTMMLKMSVDPTLLGWDDDLEDWVDSDSL